VRERVPLARRTLRFDRRAPAGQIIERFGWHPFPGVSVYQCPRSLPPTGDRGDRVLAASFRFDPPGDTYWTNMRNGMINGGWSPSRMSFSKTFRYPKRGYSAENSWIRVTKAVSSRLSGVLRFVDRGRSSTRQVQLGVLALELLQAPGFRNVHPAELRSPSVEGRLREVVQPARLADVSARLGFLQNPDNLLFRESLPLHLVSDRLLRGG